MKNFELKTKPKPASNATPPKKKGKNWFSRLNAWLHLWPSIVSGLIVVFVCLTGTIIVYCDEILELSAGNAKYVEVKGPKATAVQLMESVKETNPNLEISQLVFFNDPKRSVRARAFNEETKKLNLIYINPYTAEVLKVDYTIHFFFVTAHLHASLLAHSIGGWIVLISTVIFLISCITGLILWWPKRWTKKTKQDSFTIKWKAKFKRLNYDLHNVYGFYSLLLCFILSATGIIIFFHASLGTAIIRSFGGSDEHLEAALPAVDESRTSLDLAQFAYRALEKNPEKKNASIWLYNLDKVGAYTFQMGVSGLKSTENLGLEVFDKYNGQHIAVERPFVLHEKVENYVWQLHMGQWWGQFGKLSTFLGGIIATSLPITGFLIWWGRRKKKKRALH
ncbi:PepSY-associated TM helix domain-containing protein [Sphingobacterium mizutaii]|uniref:PepSY-associated TM helix domain-containing protein n=1 Tax=Sphingobacterium mizutaii TaxID=1010 RepID=UPI0016262F01|nr:PepSY-associated TM helix domain-containing protein [Sphingobacterium mizutaii]